MTLHHFTRRTILCTASLLLLTPALAFASPASDFVASFSNQIIHILNAPTSFEQKRQEILPILKENVDIPAIGRYCLGRYWHTASLAQQQRYLELFNHVLLGAVTAQIGNYQNISLKLAGSVSSPAGEQVHLIISRPKQPDITMIALVNGTPLKVIDLYGEGASMRMTKRSDYTAYLSSHNGNIQTLIDALQQQVNSNQSESR